MMTYVEFFSPMVSENICTCLARAPERVVLVGDSRKLLQRHAVRYRELFIERGKDIEFLVCSVNRNDMKSIIDALVNLVETYDDCVFDLTGGEDLYLVAMGIVSERYKERNIQMQRMNIRMGTVIDCDLDGNVLKELEMPRVSVEENIRFYGGRVIREGAAGAYHWDLSKEMIRDVAAMWEICRRNVGNWNRLVTLFAHAESQDQAPNSPLFVKASLKRMRQSLWFAKESYLENSAELQELVRQGMLTQCEWSEGTLLLQFKNRQIKRVLMKAGNLLELVICCVAKEATNSKGAVYNDVMTGVGIDWDEQKTADGAATQNEIDVLLTHGMIPVFISCKNGAVDMDELFKLSAVAARFGGTYAKRVLVAPALSAATNGESIRARAEDMNIRLLDKVHQMSFGELRDVVSGLWKTADKRK